MSYYSRLRTSKTTVANDLLLNDPPSDTVSALDWSKNGGFLAASSWDNKVRIYQVLHDLQNTGLVYYEHDQPVLTTKFSWDDKKVFSGGGDFKGMEFDIQTRTKSVFATHEGPVSCMALAMENIVATGSWDKSVKFWDLRQKTAIHTFSFNYRVYHMDSDFPCLAIALSGPKIVSIDLRYPTKIVKEQSLSKLRQINSIKAFNYPRLGFAYGSSTGRISVCHLEPQTIPSGQKKDDFAIKGYKGVDGKCYGLNAIATINQTNYMVLGNADGEYQFFDKDPNSRGIIKKFTVPDKQPITSMSISKDFVLAYACGYDWSKGYKGHEESKRPYIALRKLTQEDFKK